MKRISLISLLLVGLLAGDAFAFDGNRKGFVVGGGLGLAPTISWSVDRDEDSQDDQGAGGGVNVVIGYAWDEHNMLVYEANLTNFTSRHLHLLRPYESVSQGFSGASWYHYFGPQGKTFYTVVGLGFYVFEGGWSDWWGYRSHDPGAALMLGGGYEFARHFQVGAYASAGKTLGYKYDWKHSHVSVLVSVVAF